MPGIWVDEKSGNVYINGKLLSPPLTAHQFSLLRLLYRNKGSICDTDTIIKEVFGQEYMEKVDDQRIAQLVSRLRKRIEPEGKPWQYIQTIHGRGLRLRDGDSPDD
jgi:DNA-binding response OmpR family regulator